MQPERAFHGGLPQRSSGHELEHDPFNDVVAIGALKLEWLPSEKCLMHTEGLRAQDGWISHVALYCHQSKSQSPARGITGGPVFARPGIISLTVYLETDAIGP